MGLVPFKPFDITTQAGRDAEKAYLRKRIKEQNIMLCVVYGSAIFFLIVMAIVFYVHS